MEIETIKGDGGQRKMPAPTLAELKEEVAALADAQEKGSFYSEAANVRFCMWEGQSDDGLMHGDHYTGEVEPFDGAIDSRVRDVDLVINDEAKLMVVAAMKARLTITDPTGENAAGAAKMQSALEYYLKRKIGWQWFIELSRLANFMLGDSPGIGFLAANWVTEEAVGYEELTMEEIRQMFIMASLRPDEGEAPIEDEQVLRARVEEIGAMFTEAVMNPETPPDVLEAMIATMFPELKPGRLNKMAKSLLKQARAGLANPIVDFPKKYIRRDEPIVRAGRLGEDYFLPSDVRDFKETPYYFMVYNLTRTGVEAKAIEEDWTDAFKTAVLGIEGSDGLKGNFVFRRYGKDNQGRMRTVDDDTVAHRYQVITAVFKSINDDGAPGIYYLTFHPEVPDAASDIHLVNYKHGNYPAVAFAREYISNALLQSRGVADVWGAQQNQRKKLHDAGSNNALLAGVPPVLSKNRRGASRAWLKPFKEVALRRDGDLKYMDPPKYPTQIRDQLESLAVDRDTYFGRRNEKIPKEAADLYEQYTVLGFMGGIREVLVQLMQLIQQFSDPDTLSRISAQSGDLIRSREEIMGQFDLDLKFNPRWMDTEYLAAYGEIINGLVVTLDRDKTINTSPIAQQILYALDPDLAPSAIRDEGTAQTEEVRDEQDIFVRIAAGIEPEMDEDPNAKNYALRLQWLENQLQVSPAWQQWPEINQEILQSHVANYQQMVAQQENARTGRSGVESVTGMV